MSSELSEKYRFEVLKGFFKEKGIVRHQLDTFNDFLNNGIQRVVKESDIVVETKEQKYTVTFGDVYIPNPSVIEEDRSVRQIYPAEARKRDLTYDSPIYVDVVEKLEVPGQEPEVTRHGRVPIGRTPIMLLSDKCNLKLLTPGERIKKGECEWDYGGYFIMRGKERVLVGQMRGVYNQPIVLEQKEGEKYRFICETRSMSEETGHSVLLQSKIGTDDRSIVFSLPNIKECIPVGIVFKSLGFTADDDIRDIIGLYDDKCAKYIKYILRDATFVKTKEEALKHIGQFAVHHIKDDKRVDYALQIVENELLPHMGITSTIKEKAYFMGNMISKLIRTHVGLRNEDDRDNYINKRVEMAGVLCCELFRGLFKRFLKSIQTQLEKKKQYPDILNIISRTSNITTGLKSSFCIGAGTLISLSNGTSLPIENVTDQENVFGYKNKGIITAEHGGSVFQGIKDTIKLTFEDGKTLVCTPDHRILVLKDNKEKEWVDAGKIPINSRIVSGIENPADNPQDDYGSTWTLNTIRKEVLEQKWSVGTQEERCRTLALARIIGYIITDEHETSNGVLHFGTAFDANNFIQDYKLVTDTEGNLEIKSGKCDTSFTVTTSDSLLKSLKGVVTGEKVPQKRSIPDFILDENCPKSVVREFLGGLFGGDGHCPSLDSREGQGTRIDGVKFSWTTTSENLNSLKELFENICKLLTKVGVEDSYINGPYHTSELDSHDRYFYRICINSNTQFNTRVGFRYCIHKTYKTNVVSCYWRMEEEIKRQHSFIVETVNDLKLRDKKITIENALVIARNMLKEKEYLQTTHGLPDAKNFIKAMGALYMFEGDYVCDKNEVEIPCFSVKLVDIRENGKHPVYDITNVAKCNSFLGSGLVLHNCTGNWAVQKNNYVRTGVSQVLSRMTHGAVLSHMRRVVLPIGREGKNAKIRQIHSSQIMYICNCECFDPETPILTWEGKVKLAKDILVGDVLIDDKGLPTRVKSTCAGVTDMYEVVNKKNNFMNYTVTSNHILTLEVRTNKLVKNRGKSFEVMRFLKDELRNRHQTFKTREEAEEFVSKLPDSIILDIELEKYLKLPNSVKKKLVGFKSKGIKWEERKISLDPYILGMWLGDGFKSGSGFCTKDEELLNYWKKWAQNNGYTVTLRPGKHSTIEYNYTYNVENGDLRKHLSKYNLIDNKHIPIDYLCNSRDVRLKVLAGLIDTDGNVRANGHEIRIQQGPKNNRIIYDTERLAQSLGFNCHVNECEYKELYITGEFLYEIPTLLSHKKLNKFLSETSRKRCSSFAQTPFKIVEKGLGEFVGWQLEGNGRFLLSDCTTVHNTPEGQSIGIVLNLSLLTTVTLRVPTVIVKEIIENSENLIFLNNYDGRNDKTKVLLNGILMGLAIDPYDFLEEMKGFRSSGMLHRDVSFTFDTLDNEIRVFSDEGRLIRPVFTVDDDNKLKIKESDNLAWDELVERELIQYVDNSEVENAVIAMNDHDLTSFKCNFQEIHPSMMLGVMASAIPFPDHSQCIFKDEPVYMYDGTVKKICDVKVGDMVITFDPDTLKQSYTSVVHVETHPTEKPLFEITTISGRKITATFDHRFMTSEGWKRLEELEVYKSLIGVSLEPIPLSNIAIDYKTAVSDLKHLHGTHRNLPIIARLFGYTFFEEISTNDETENCIILKFESQYDLEMFEKDVNLLNIRSKSFKFGDRKIIYEGDFPALLQRLRDSEDPSQVPKWIVKGSDMVKREFLASLQYTYVKPDLVFNLYEYLGIDFKRLQIPHTIEDGLLVFPLTFKEYNYIKFYERVGVRYNYLKNIDCGLTAEYLKYVRYHRSKNMSYTPVCFEKWTEKNEITSTTLFIFIDTLKKSSETVISDITVDSLNQSFLCGDTFCVHNSPRNIYQSSMSKQAIGVYALSHQLRTDTITHVLDYPQKPLVNTMPADFLGFNDMPAGINAIVAVACYSSFNQEDSVILNKAAVERGLFVSTSYRTLVDEEKKQGTYNFETIGPPPIEKRKKNCNYSYLDERGLVKKRINGKSIYVEKGDVIIGKTLTKSNKNGEEELIDCSYVIKHGEEGYIDRVIETITPNGYKMIKITIRNRKIPEIGDKFACFDSETEVLTSNGWKYIYNILLDDKVACLKEDKILEYHTPIKLQSYDYKGKMYRVKSDKVDLLVTPNHRMYTGNCHRKKYDTRRADEIYGKIRSYKNNVNEWTPENCLKTFVLPGYGDLPDLELDLEAWCIFFGIWIAEGSCNITYLKTGGVGSRQVNIAANNPHVKENLEKCMEVLGFKWNYHMDRGEPNKWYCGDLRLIYYLHPLSVGDVNKSLPEWCFNLDIHHSQKLIECMCLGDGDFMKDTTTVRYYTSSIKLRDDFQRLCLHTGWGCNYYLKSEKGRKIDDRQIVSTEDHWSLTVCKTQTNPLVNKYIKNGKQLDSWVDFNDKVYCCTVPTKDGVIFVRRNGKSIWCGQSRGAQKGTTGLIMSQEDMPFTPDGIVPDLILNPLAIPSRMTINVLLEMILGKSCVIEGTFGDATPFTSNSTDVAESLCERLEKHGFNKFGWETLISGYTGEMIPAKIYMAPSFYSRLKHMVGDKIHSRASGHVTALFRQPLEGRSKDGGLRFGEMERDCIIAHGSSRFLKERLFEKSDPYTINVCETCGNIATSQTECKFCNEDKISKVGLPYASKLLVQELMAMNIKVLFKVKE